MKTNQVLMTIMAVCLVVFVMIPVPSYAAGENENGNNLIHRSEWESNYSQSFSGDPDKIFICVGYENAEQGPVGEGWQDCGTPACIAADIQRLRFHQVAGIRIENSEDDRGIVADWPGFLAGDRDDFISYIRETVAHSLYEVGDELESDRLPNVRVAEINVILSGYGDSLYTESLHDGEIKKDDSGITDLSDDEFEMMLPRMRYEGAYVFYRWEMADDKPATVEFKWKGDAPEGAALPEKVTGLAPSYAYDYDGNPVSEGYVMNVHEMPEKAYRKGHKIEGEKDGTAGIYTFEGWSVDEDTITCGELKDKFILDQEHVLCDCCFGGYASKDGRIVCIRYAGGQHSDGDDQDVCSEDITPIYLAKWRSDKRPDDLRFPDDLNEQLLDLKYKFTFYGTWKFEPTGPTDPTDPTDPTKPTNDQGGNTDGNTRDNIGGNTGDNTGGKHHQSDNDGGDKSSGSSKKATDRSVRTGDASSIVGMLITMMMAAAAAVVTAVHRREA